jgi:exopolysaccharide biosynthesis polyprenyl glycosylphosphotransferase
LHFLEDEMVVDDRRLVETQHSDAAVLVGDLEVVGDTESKHSDRVIDLRDESRREAVDRPTTQRAVAVGMFITDVVCLAAALVISYLVQHGLRPLAPEYVLVIALAPVVWTAVFHAFALYCPRRLSPPEELRRVMSAVSLGVVLLVLASFWSESALSREWIGATWVVALVLELGTRRWWRWRINALHHEGRLTLKTVIVGDNDEAEKLATTLRRPGLGFTPLGYVSSNGSPGVANGLPTIGPLDRLSDLIRENGVECVFVASSSVGPQQMLRVVQAVRQSSAEVRVTANLPQILTSRLAPQLLGETVTLSLKPVKLTGTQALIKRAFDLVVASVGLLAASPLLLLTAAAIKATSRGPVLFCQDRVTSGGRSFRMYKFRTMVANANEILRERGIDPSAPFFKLERDPRLTGVGKVIRRLSIDELPQLLNVVKGDMSLVGPRPLPADQVAANLEMLAPRHEVRAGVSGWWQINGRSDVDPEAALRLDLFYIENWSLTLDLYIVLKTVGAVLRRKGAL